VATVGGGGGLGVGVGVVPSPSLYPVHRPATAHILAGSRPAARGLLVRLQKGGCPRIPIRAKMLIR
jgi:hypothetical protein